MDRAEDEDVVVEHVPDNAAELAARIRAARAYAGRSQNYMAAQLGGMSVTTYKRLERGTRLASLDEQTTIAEACEVPLAFLQQGFPGSGSDDDNRRDLLIALLRSLDDRFDAMVAEVVDTMLLTEPSKQAAGKPRRSRPRGAGRGEARHRAA